MNSEPMESTNDSKWMIKPEDVTNEEHASLLQNVVERLGDHLSVEGQLEFSSCIAVLCPVDIFFF